MLFLTTDDITIRIVTFLCVSVFFFPAVIDRRNGTFFDMGMFRNLAGQIALSIVTSITMDMFFLTAVTENFLFFFLRKFAVAQNSGIVHVIGDILDTVFRIALNGLHLGRLGFENLGQKAHMVRKPVALPVVENDIAGLGGISFSLMIKAKLRQIFNPRTDTVVDGDVVHTGIAQAEGNKHAAPVTIGYTVPVTVTGVSMDGSIFPDGIIPAAFRISQLGFRNGHHIPVTVTAQLHMGKGGFPDLPGFHICIRIGIAGFYVDMYFQSTDGIITFTGMNMFFCCIAADRLCLNQNLLKAAFAMYMGFCGWLRTDQFRLRNLCLPFFITAGICGFPIITCIRMPVTGILLKTAA